MNQKAVEMMGKCPMRRPQSCGLMDVQLGFVLGVDDGFCERCHELGPGTQQALEVRTGLVQLTVEQMKPRWPNIRHPGLRELVGGAMTEEERSRAQERVVEPPKPQKHRWLGLLWDGLPYPWLLMRAVGRGMKVWWGETKRVGWPWSKRSTGCGCLSTPKRYLSRLKNTLSGGNSK